MPKASKNEPLIQVRMTIKIFDKNDLEWDENVIPYDVGDRQMFKELKIENPEHDFFWMTKDVNGEKHTLVLSDNPKKVAAFMKDIAPITKPTNYPAFARFLKGISEK